METIELWNGNTKALISTDGAWLTNLSNENGDILYPKRTLTAPDGSQKIRGGCHVCLPNFAAAGDSGLAQHGFGHTSLWTVINQTESSVTLALKGGAPGYESLQSTLIYELNDGSIIFKLELKNTGNTPLRVAPGFHPYFALQSDEGRVKIGDQAYDLVDLSGTLYEQGGSKKLLTNRRKFTLSSDNLPTWAIWTDQLAPYVCVEPTFDGPTFLNKTPANSELLDSGKSQTYNLIAGW